MKDTFKRVGNSMIVVSDNVELKSDKIELNIKDDINKAVSEYDALSKKMDDGLTKFYNEIFSAKKTFEDNKAAADKWFSYQKVLKEEKEKALSLGKELGIDVTSAPFYKDLISALSRFDDMYSEFLSANSTYKSIKI